MDPILELDLVALLDVQEEDLALDLDQGLDTYLESDLALDFAPDLDTNLAVDLGYDLGCETGLILDRDTDMETL